MGRGVRRPAPSRIILEASRIGLEVAGHDWLVAMQRRVAGLDSLTVGVADGVRERQRQNLAPRRVCRHVRRHVLR